MIRDLIRCCIFGVFGPGLGLLTVFVIAPDNAKDLGADTFVWALLFAYLNGLVPALITAAFDSYLDRKGTRNLLKYLLTGIFGYAAAYVNLIGSLLLFLPTWGLLGAVPAVICSAVTDQLIGPAQECWRA